MNEKMFGVVVVVVLLCGSGIRSLKMYTFTVSVVNINFFTYVYLFLYPGLLTSIEGTKFPFSVISFSFVVLSSKYSLCYGCI